jgi:hypothetical protein
MRAPGVAQIGCIIIEKWVAAKPFPSLVFEAVRDRKINSIPLFCFEAPNKKRLA